MDVAFDMIHGDQRKFMDHGERFRVGHADQQRSDQSRALRDRDRAQAVETRRRFPQGEANHGNDGAEMFARSELGDHAAVFGVRGDLRRDDGGKNARSVLDHGSRRLIAGRFDPQDAHAFMVASLA